MKINFIRMANGFFLLVFGGLHRYFTDPSYGLKFDTIAIITTLFVCFGITLVGLSFDLKRD